MRLKSQAFIQSWFGQYNRRYASRAEWGFIEQARTEIGEYIDRYCRRRQLRLGYRSFA